MKPRDKLVRRAPGKLGSSRRPPREASRQRSNLRPSLRDRLKPSTRSVKVTKLTSKLKASKAKVAHRDKRNKDRIVVIQKRVREAPASKPSRSFDSAPYDNTYRNNFSPRREPGRDRQDALFLDYSHETNGKHRKVYRNEMLSKKESRLERRKERYQDDISYSGRIVRDRVPPDRKIPVDTDRFDKHLRDSDSHRNADHRDMYKYHDNLVNNSRPEKYDRRSPHENHSTSRKLDTSLSRRRDDYISKIPPLMSKLRVVDRLSPPLPEKHYRRSMSPARRLTNSYDRRRAPSYSEKYPSPKQYERQDSYIRRKDPPPPLEERSRNDTSPKRKKYLDSGRIFPPDRRNHVSPGRRLNNSSPPSRRANNSSPLRRGYVSSPARRANNSSPSRRGNMSPARRVNNSSPPRRGNMSPARRAINSSPPRRGNISPAVRRVVISSPARRRNLSSSPRRGNVSSPTRRANNSSPHRRNNMSPPRRGVISSPTWRGISPPARRGNVSSPVRRSVRVLPFRRGNVSSPARRIVVAPSVRRGKISSPIRRGFVSSPSRSPPRRGTVPSPARRGVISSPPRRSNHSSPPRRLISSPARRGNDSSPRRSNNFAPVQRTNNLSPGRRRNNQSTIRRIRYESPPPPPPPLPPPMSPPPPPPPPRDQIRFKRPRNISPVHSDRSRQRPASPPRRIVRAFDRLSTPRFEKKSPQDDRKAPVLDKRDKLLSELALGVKLDDPRSKKRLPLPERLLPEQYARSRHATASATVSTSVIKSHRHISTSSPSPPPPPPKRKYPEDEKLPWKRARSPIRPKKPIYPTSKDTISPPPWRESRPKSRKEERGWRQTNSD